MTNYKFFNLDLHVSVIADVKNIFATLFPHIEIVDMSISGHTWVMGKTKADVKIINDKTWRYIDRKLIDIFHNLYDDFLCQFDGFIVTHTPVFALLYEKYGKPIILVNSCRYEQPFSWNRNNKMREFLEFKLQKMNRSGQLIVICNNKADLHYLKLGTGIDGIHIPSLCLYTNTQYSGVKNEFIIKGPRIIPLTANMVYLDNVLRQGYVWDQLYSYKGIIHLPYEISTMSIFEQYSANVPLFFPQKYFLKQLISNNKLYLQSRYYFHSTPNSPYPSKLEPALGPEWLDFWIENADYYDQDNMKYITYFDSFADLQDKLRIIDTADISHKITEWNKIRKNNVYSKWRYIIDKLLK